MNINPHGSNRNHENSPLFSDNEKENMDIGKLNIKNDHKILKDKICKYLKMDENIFDELENSNPEVLNLIKRKLDSDSVDENKTESNSDAHSRVTETQIQETKMFLPRTQSFLWTKWSRNDWEEFETHVDAINAERRSQRFPSMSFEDILTGINEPIKRNIDLILLGSDDSYNLNWQREWN
jgi:hypothetical protein